MASGEVDRRIRRRIGWRRWGVLAGATVLVAGMPEATAQVTVGPPEFTGRWTLPFEEGGIETPTCSVADDGRLVCKPVAQAMSVLPDGRVFYFNGLEGQENAGGNPLGDAAAMRNSQSRLLDLRSGSPVWSVPSSPTGGASNPDARPRPSPADEVEALPGVAGVPGRPGDGPVGSVWGEAGGPATPPTAPPEDSTANDGDMFCADVASLPDGRLLIAGGADWHDEPAVAAGEESGPSLDAGLPEVSGLRTTRIFDPRTDSFTQTGPMNFNRWYPSLVTLADGKVLAAGGAAKRVKNTQGGNVRRTETFDPATGTWQQNYNSLASETSLPLSPSLHLMPDGRVLYTGAGQGWAPFGVTADQGLFGMLQFYDPRTSQWEVWGPHTLGMREGASSILLPLDPPYHRGTVLTFGGTLGTPPGGAAAVPLSTLTRVDRDGAVNEKLTRFTMLEGRWFPSAVGLPDGTVLSAGGATSSDTMAPGTGMAVRTVELFDYRTERWYSMARISRDRTYHHSAVLLPDARVLLGGHAPAASVFGPGGDFGGPFPNNARDASFEIFSPHYLFRGPRPTIRHVQAGIRWGETFDLISRQALDIEAVVLVRLPSPQHGIDSDQRTVRLAFTRHSHRLRVTAPPDGTIAPPGYYYLFINRRTPRGPVPSMARIVRVGDEVDLSEADQPFPDEATLDIPGSAHEDERTGPLTSVEDEVEGLVGRTVLAEGGFPPEVDPPLPRSGDASTHPGRPQTGRLDGMEGPLDGVEGPATPLVSGRLVAAVRGAAPPAAGGVLLLVAAAACTGRGPRFRRR